MGVTGDRSYSNTKLQCSFNLVSGGGGAAMSPASISKFLTGDRSLSQKN